MSRSGPGDLTVRLAAFKWLEEQTQRHGEVLPWKLLQRGFDHDGQRVPLVAMQGIFKPAVLPTIPLTIRTSHEGPYDDSFGYDGLLKYRYRGTDPAHRDNVGLREAMRRQIPLIYLHGVVKGRYLVVWPVYIVGDDPTGLTFTVAVDDQAAVQPMADGRLAVADTDNADARRTYITATVRRRLHQQGFRERVLRAYREQCALCRLRHTELLDAAHIQPDASGGEPTVTNGLALCKIHHAAFDRYFLTVRPDYTIEIARRILVETDGPMLRHGLQELNGVMIHLPGSTKNRPDRELLADRLQRFREAG